MMKNSLEQSGSFGPSRSPSCLEIVWAEPDPQQRCALLQKWVWANAYTLLVLLQKSCSSNTLLASTYLCPRLHTTDSEYH